MTKPKPKREANECKGCVNEVPSVLASGKQRLICSRTSMHSNRKYGKRCGLFKLRGNAVNVC